MEKSVHVITSADFMSRFCSNLGLPKQVQSAAAHIAKKSVDLDLVGGRSPLSLAAAAIYMASQVYFSLATQVSKFLFRHLTFVKQRVRLVI